jgi:4-amino-4-deoxy-L-arabinose transferase-like glycosyltransferase
MTRRVVLASIGLFFLCSMIMYLSVPTSHSCFDIDSTGYHTIAQHWCSNGFLCDPRAPGQAPVQTVGYHFVVGTFYKVFGCSTAPIIFFQIFLAAISLLLIFKIARFFFDSRVAACTVALCCVNIGFLVYPQFLLAETVLVAMALLSIERFLSFWKTGNVWSLAAAGLVGGCSLIVKPSLLLFFFVALCFVAARPCRRRAKILYLFVFMATFLAPLLGYLTYNKVEYGYFNLAPMKSLNIYYVFLSKVIARVHDIPVQQAEKIIPPFSSSNSLDERGWDGARTLFWHYVRRYPGTCFVVWTHNVAKTVFGLYSTQLKLLFNPALTGGDVSFFKEQGSVLERMRQYIERGASSWVIKVVAWLEALWSVVRYLFVLVALGALVYFHRYDLFLFFLMFIGLGVGMTGFDGCCRYRIVVEPFLIMLCAWSLVFLYDVVRGRTTRKVR